MILQTWIQAIGQRLQERGWMLSCAESCTGGGIAQAITAVPGASHWFDSGFITYSNRAKERLLGVSSELLRAHGAVSAPAVIAMVRGCLARSAAQVGLAVSGIAGPSGGTPEKPVGTVYFAWAWLDQEPIVHRQHFPGDRQAVREQSIEYALETLLQWLK